MPGFDLIDSKDDREVSLVAFDLLKKDGEDLRLLRLEEHKRRLQYLLTKIHDGIEFGDQIEGDGTEIRGRVRART